MNEPEIQNTTSDETAAPVRRGENSEPPSKDDTDRRSAEERFLNYYGLNEQPFGVTPDLRFLYLGAKHRQALDVLNYGTELNRGFLTLIAEAGMGKTSLLFQYLEGLRNKARTVFLFQTDCDSTDLMRYLMVELGLDGKGMDLPEMRAVLSQVLMGEMQAGRRFVLVIDEAQNLDEKVLESVRLLSNFETPWMKLMHIVLAGQPQLADRLAKPSMKQFQQRVSFAIRIEPFTREEVDQYIDHRLWVAGYKGEPLFSVGARALLAERSEGIPRIINNMCFSAMSFAWAKKEKTVDRDMMAEVLDDLEGRSTTAKESPAVRLPEEPKPITTRDSSTSAASQPLQAIGLTLKAPSPRSWMSTIVAAAMVAIVLGWLGVQFRVDKRIGPLLHDFSTSVRSVLTWSPAPSSLVPASTASPNESPTSLGSETVSDEKDAKLPQQDPVASSTSGQGQN